MTNTDSPFILRPSSASSQHPQHKDSNTDAKPRSNEKQRGTSFGTVLGESKIEGTLYWNPDAASSSLVCGSSNNEILRTVMQMIRLHLSDKRNSSALIFHANTRDHILPPSQVTTVQIAKRLAAPTVFLAPRPRQYVKERYTDIPLPSSDVLPLRFAEKDISLAHVLALCTPPEDYPSREAILVKVQGLVGRLAEPFSIQEFNRIIDEEQWDEHESSFMALRQSLLTTLTLADGEGDLGFSSKANFDISSRMMSGAPIIVDLSDPVLRSTVKPDAKKFLVLDQAPEYLNPTSALLNTLVALLSMHADCPIRTLLSTVDVGQLSSRLLNHLDSLILHECRSPAWLSHIQQHVSCPIPSQTVYGLESRQALIISPRSSSHLHGHEEHGHDHKGDRWGTQVQKVEIGWEWPLSIEQQKIEQLQALVAQLSHNSTHLPQHPNPQNQAASTTTGAPPTRRSRKESTYVETTMNALRSALGYLATRRAAELSNDTTPESSPALATKVPAPGSAITGTAADTGTGTHTRTPTMTGTVVNENEPEEKKALAVASVILEESSGQESGGKKSSGPESIWPKSSAQESEWPKSSEQESEWMKKPLTHEPKFFTPPRVRDFPDLGPFSAGEVKPLILPRRQSLAQLSSPSSPYDKTKLSDAIFQAISNAGGALGMPVSSQKVGDAFRRSAPPDVFRVPVPPSVIEVQRMSEPHYGHQSWRMSVPNVPGAWRTSMPPEDLSNLGFGKAVTETGFSTWKEIVTFAEKEGILKVISNGKEEWVVMPKPPTPRNTIITEGLEVGDTGAPVLSPDGWYDKKEKVAFPALLEKALIKTKIDTSVYEPLIETISSLQAKQVPVQAPLLLVSVSYELKRLFPTAIRDAGFKTVLEYIHGAQARGLVEITDDMNGSIYVRLAEPMQAEINPPPAAPRPPVSDISAISTDKSQPESSGMPSSEIHVPYPKDKFEPLLAVLRSLKKHHLYKVTLVPLSLAIEKMFPNAMTRFGVGSIEEYITQAQEAGLVTTGSTANGNLWVSLSENMDTGSITPTQRRAGRSASTVSAADFPLPPATNRPPNFSRLLRAIRALSTPGHQRVLCSRVGMMLNKDDYKAMNVESFNQALVAASKANLIVHGGVAGNAWVALKAPEVAGISSGKHKLEEPRARLQKMSPPEIAINPVMPSGSAYKLPLSEADIEPFRPLLAILRTFIHGKHIAEPFRTVVEKNLLKAKSDVLMAARCHSMEDYILRAQSYGLIAQVGHGKAARLRLLENSGLAIL